VLLHRGLSGTAAGPWADLKIGADTWKRRRARDAVGTGAAGRQQLDANERVEPSQPSLRLPGEPRGETGVTVLAVHGGGAGEAGGVRREARRRLCSRVVELLRVDR
jgi:hypothetical protein